MQAVAWDDEPNGYMKDLADELSVFGIEVTVHGKKKEFIQAYNNPSTKWDFVITDLVTGNATAISENDAKTGLEIARKAARDGLPVFIVTQHYARFDPTAYGIPAEVVIRSKSTDPGWQAGDIHDELRRRGLITDPKQVFLIFGHDRTAVGTTAIVERHLRKQQIQVVKVTQDNLFTEISRGLIDRMHYCRAIVAICTPDDKVKNGRKKPYFQARPNVLHEIGIALGLARGPQRLTILEKYGSAQDEKVQMPSDLGGLISIRFETVEDVLPNLDARLRQLGVELG